MPIASAPRIVPDKQHERYRALKRKKVAYAGISAKTAEFVEVFFPASLDKDRSLAPTLKALSAWMRDDARFSDKYSRSIQRDAASMFRHFPNRADFTREWARAFGLVEAAKLEMMPDTFGMGPGPERYFERSKATPNVLNDFVFACYSLADVVDERPDELGALGDHLRPLAPDHPTARLALARLIRDQAAIDSIAREAAASDDVIKTLAKLQISWSDVDRTPELPICDARDPIAVEALCRRALPHLRYRTCDHLGPLVFTMPADVVTRIFLLVLPMIEKESGVGSLKYALGPATAIDDAELASFLAMRAHYKNYTPLLLDYFIRFPERRAQLEDVARGKSKAATAAAAVLDAARRQGPALEPAKKTKAAKLPSFADAKSLPALVDREGATLPEAEVTALLSRLSVAPHDAPAFCAEARARLTPASRDAFARTLVSDWALAGAHARHEWALFAAGHLGADETAKKLEAMIPSLLARRITLRDDVIDALALMDSDVARTLLYVRAFGSHYADTRTRIRAHLEAAARRRVITYAALEDQVLRTLAREPERDLFIERFLESTLRDERSWTLADFRALFVGEPALRSLALRLVWESDGKVFRLDEDGSFADASDQTLTLGAKARIRLAHPVTAPRRWDAMKRVFADYEIIQPFPQLDRETFTKVAECKSSKGRVVPWSAVDTLLSARGWSRPPARGEMVRTVLFPLDCVKEGAAFELAISPGLTFGAVKARPKQTLGAVALRKVAEADLPPPLLSELVRDVCAL